MGNSISQNSGEFEVGGEDIWSRQDGADCKRITTKVEAVPRLWGRKLFVRSCYTGPGKEGKIWRHSWPVETRAAEGPGRGTVGGRLGTGERKETLFGSFCWTWMGWKMRNI